MGQVMTAEQVWIAALKQHGYQGGVDLISAYGDEREAQGQAKGYREGAEAMYMARERARARVVGWFRNRPAVVYDEDTWTLALSLIDESLRTECERLLEGAPK